MFHLVFWAWHSMLFEVLGDLDNPAMHRVGIRPIETCLYQHVFDNAKMLTAILMLTFHPLCSSAPT